MYFLAKGDCVVLVKDRVFDGHEELRHRSLLPGDHFGVSILASNSKEPSFVCNWDDNVLFCRKYLWYMDALEQQVLKQITIVPLPNCLRSTLMRWFRRIRTSWINLKIKFTTMTTTLNSSSRNLSIPLTTLKVCHFKWSMSLCIKWKRLISKKMAFCIR